MVRVLHLRRRFRAKRAIKKAARTTSAHTLNQLRNTATGLPKKNARVPSGVAQVTAPVAAQHDEVALPEERFLHHLRKAPRTFSIA
jgi:hypothetical protein